MPMPACPPAGRQGEHLAHMLGKIVTIVSLFVFAFVAACPEGS